MAASATRDLTRKVAVAVLISLTAVLVTAGSSTIDAQAQAPCLNLYSGSPLTATVTTTGELDQAIACYNAAPAATGAHVINLSPAGGTFDYAATRGATEITQTNTTNPLTINAHTSTIKGLGRSGAGDQGVIRIAANAAPVTINSAIIEATDTSSNNAAAVYTDGDDTTITNTTITTTGNDAAAVNTGGDDTTITNTTITTTGDYADGVETVGADTTITNTTITTTGDYAYGVDTFGVDTTITNTTITATGNDADGVYTNGDDTTITNTTITATGDDADGVSTFGVGTTITNTTITTTGTGADGVYAGFGSVVESSIVIGGCFGSPAVGGE